MMFPDYAPIIANQITPSKSIGILRGSPLVAGIEVTAIMSESHTLSAQATKQSIESGAQVTDHIIINPPTVAIVFEVANVGDGPNVAKDVFEAFKRLIEKRELIELLTDHYAYDNMAVISVTPLTAAPYKGRLQGTLNLQRVNQVNIPVVGRDPGVLGTTTNTGAREKLAGDSTKKTASTTIDAGEQNGKAVDKELVAKITARSGDK